MGKYSLDRISLELEKLVNTPPRVPERSTIYEVVRNEEVSNSDTSDNGQSTDDSDPDEIRVVDEINGGDTSATTTATVHNTQKEMSIAELFAKLSAKTDQVTQKVTQSSQEVKEEIKMMKEGTAKEFADVRKEIVEVKEDTVKLVNDKNQELKNMMDVQTQNLQEQINALKSKDDPTREIDVQMIDLQNPAPRQPTLDIHQATYEDMSEETTEYLIQSSENPAVVRSVEWLYRHLETDHQARKMDILQPIINVQNPRNTILSAIYNYKQQSITTEGMVVWDKQESGNSRSGKGAIEKLAASTTQIAKIEDEPNVEQEI